MTAAAVMSGMPANLPQPVIPKERLPIYEAFKEAIPANFLQKSTIRDKDFFQIIKSACERKDWESIRKVQNALKNLVGPDGHTIFSAYIYEGNVKLVQEIIDQKLVDVLSDPGSNFFHDAVQAGHVEILPILKKGGFGVLTATNEANQTPLDLAIESGQTKMFKHLLPANDPFGQLYPEEEGENCLHHMIRTRNYSMLAHFLRKYPDEITSLLQRPDLHGQTPIELAAKTDLVAYGLLMKHAEKFDANSSEKINFLHTIPTLSKMNGVGFSVPNFFIDPPENLVFQGGGPKGIVYVQLTKALSEILAKDGKTILQHAKRIAGTSAGAIQACALAVGCTYEDMEKMAEENPLKELIDDPRLYERLEVFKEKFEPIFSSLLKNGFKNFWNVFSSILKEGSIFDAMTLLNIKWKLENRDGLFTVKKFGKLIEKTIAEKTGISNLTFGELAELVKKDKNKYKHLHVFATKIANKSHPEEVRFSSEDPKCRDIVIWSAVTCSMAIPVFFQTPTLLIKKEGILIDEGIPFIDGGLINNLPSHAFDYLGFVHDDIPSNFRMFPIFNPRTLCFNLYSPLKEKTATENNDPTVKDVIASMFNVFRHVDPAVAARNEYNIFRTVRLNHHEINLFDFHIKPNKGIAKKAGIAAYNKLMAFFNLQMKAQKGGVTLSELRGLDSHDLDRDHDLDGDEEVIEEDIDIRDLDHDIAKVEEDSENPDKDIGKKTQPFYSFVGDTFRSMLMALEYNLRIYMYSFTTIKDTICFLSKTNGIFKLGYKADALAKYNGMSLNLFYGEKDDIFFYIKHGNLTKADEIFNKHQSYFRHPAFSKAIMPILAFASDKKCIQYFDKKGIDVNVESLTGPLIHETLYLNCYNAFETILCAQDYDRKNQEKRLLDGHENTILHAIAEEAMKTPFEMLKKHRKFKSLLNVKNGAGVTPIFTAVEKGQIDFAKKLMAHKSIDLTVVHSKTGKTLLHLFAQRESEKDFDWFVNLARKRKVLDEIVELENKNGLDFDDPSEEVKGRCDSILFATVNKHILEELIDMGIQLDKKQSKTQKTFPYYCVSRQHFDLLKKFCKKSKATFTKERYNAILNAQVNSNQMKKEVSINSLDKPKQVSVKKTPIRLAAQKDYLDVIKFLVDEEADFTSQVDGKTPLECAPKGSASYKYLVGKCQSAQSKESVSIDQLVEDWQQQKKGETKKVDREKNLVELHQNEVDQVIACLKSAAPSDIKIQNQNAEAKATRTIVVQVGLEDSDLADYHYMIKRTEDISEDELQEILSQSDYAWFKETDYYIEDNVFKVFRHLSPVRNFGYKQNGKSQPVKKLKSSVILNGPKTDKRNPTVATKVPVSKPTQESIQKPLENNAHGQRNNSKYLYTGSDIGMIVNSTNIQAELQNFHFIQGQQAKHLEQKLPEIRAHINQGKPVLCVYNISNDHWTTFCLLKDASGKLIALYKDSFGGKDSELVTLLGKESAEIKSHPIAEQEGDTTSCGILAIANMRTMADELKKDREGFIRDFEKQKFCTLERAKKLRRGDFANFYLDGKRNHEKTADKQKNNARKLSEEHQNEVDLIMASLKKVIPPEITVQAEEAKKGATRTIVIEIGAEDSNSTDYHYRIEPTKDITQAELEKLLRQSPYKWSKDKDYRIEDGIIKVFKKDQVLEQIA